MPSFVQRRDGFFDCGGVGIGGDDLEISSPANSLSPPFAHCGDGLAANEAAKLGDEALGCSKPSLLENPPEIAPTRGSHREFIQGLQSALREQSRTCDVRVS
jgi:hypothetical protein